MSVFGGGYLVDEAHLLGVEMPWTWANQAEHSPGHSLVVAEPEGATIPHSAYPAGLSVFFRIFRAIGLEHPESQVLILRILHGFYSLWIVVLGYLLTRALAPNRKKAASTTAWILAVGGFWPWLSVHQLVEWVCIPPLMLALWALARPDELRQQDALLAGIGMGMATGLYAPCGVMGLALIPLLLLQREGKTALTFGSAFLITYFLVTWPGLVISGVPIAEYPSGLWCMVGHCSPFPAVTGYRTIVALLAILVPPVSAMLIWGACSRRNAPPQWRRVTIPLLAFFLSLFFCADGQERLLLPMLPITIALGSAGWHRWSETHPWWQRNHKLERALWGLFWMLSSCILAATLTYQGNHTRVSAMTFLYEQGTPPFALVMVDETATPPIFYSGARPEWHIDDRVEHRANPAEVVSQWCDAPPAYLLFQGNRHLGEAVAEYKATLTGLRYITTIKPSRIDRWLHALYPPHRIERIMIYATEDALPCH